VQKNGIRGLQIRTHATEHFTPLKIKELVTKFSHSLNLSKKSSQLALNSLNFLINAEMKVHGKTKQEEIHFHELASTDTIFDIVGFAYLYEKSQLFDSSILILPIAVGGGKIEISHGTVSVPAPATLEIIKEGKLVVQGGPIEMELLTPTGAALLAALDPEPVQKFPLMSFDKNGRSFGTRSIDSESISGLQIFLGQSKDEFISESVNILETNVDDVDGETLGYLFEILYQKNLVLDLSILNTITKKNRPGYLIRAIIMPEKTIEVTEILIQSLGTLGVRVLPGYRHVVPRRTEIQEISIEDNKSTVRVKRGYLHDNIISEKVEFEDIKQIADKTNQSVHQVRKKVQRELFREDK
jgi:uncharacterized protein (TIGR00299 family) protein